MGVFDFSHERLRSKRLYFVVYRLNPQNKKLNFVFRLQLCFCNTLFINILQPKKAFDSHRHPKRTSPLGGVSMPYSPRRLVGSPKKLLPPIW